MEIWGEHNEFVLLTPLFVSLPKDSSQLSSAVARWRHIVSWMLCVR